MKDDKRKEFLNKIYSKSGLGLSVGRISIGAVTHVFVNDPTRGYGIFIENMLAEAKNK